MEGGIVLSILDYIYLWLLDLLDPFYIPVKAIDC